MIRRKYLGIIVGSAVLGYLGAKIHKRRKAKNQAKVFRNRPPLSWRPLKRGETISDLKTKSFDILIIGGGATGSTCALDAATRGLSVALVEAGDFCSETSSKSTKLLHGGIRYLEKAAKTLDLSQFALVREALQERGTIMSMAPYLTRRLPIMLPVYNKFMVPYFLMGVKIYDWISGAKSLGRSYFMNRKNTIDVFPGINGKNLVGSVVYYDGQFNDSRLGLMLALTASYYGATVSNYIKVNELIKENGIARGAICEDVKTGEILKIKSAGVICAAGPFTDKVSKAEDSRCKGIMEPSSGTHIVLPEEYAPKNMGIIHTDTSDGRVLFQVPWRGKAIVGTTDVKCKLENAPIPRQDDIAFLLSEVKKCISHSELPLDKSKILSIWTGIRPLVRKSDVTSTESLVRSHLVKVSPHKVITVTGGKWTTSRNMARDTIDKAINVLGLNPKRPCVTEYIKILGGHRYEDGFHQRLKRDMGVSSRLAEHLCSQYGDRAYKILDYLGPKGFTRLSESYEYLEQEVEYSIDNEMAISVSDILGRRLGLGFIDVKEALKCLDRVIEIMRNKLGWSKHQEKKEKGDAFRFLASLGLGHLG